MSDVALVPLEEIRPKMEFKGIIKRVELAGAVIDIGAEVEALLHISQIQSGRVKNVGDYLQEGKEVTVWVRRVDVESRHILVTMIKPAAIGWQELTVGQVHRGTVSRIEKFGVFVDIGAERPGLVHVSELASNYVKSPEDVVQKGQEVEVKIIGLNRRKNQIDLSVKALQTEEKSIPIVENEDSTEELPTAMAIALQRAMSDSPNSTAESQPAKQRRRQSDEREEIFRRTLQKMEDQ